MAFNCLIIDENFGTSNCTSVFVTSCVHVHLHQHCWTSAELRRPIALHRSRIALQSAMPAAAREWVRARVWVEATELHRLQREDDRAAARGEIRRQVHRVVRLRPKATVTSRDSRLAPPRADTHELACE